MTLALTTGTSQPAADDFVFRAVHRSTISGHERVLRLNDLNAKVGGILSVKEYGAVGDGVTDDTAAFAAALAASPTIYVPRAASSYIVGDLEVPPNARIVGATAGNYRDWFGASETNGKSTLRLKAGASCLMKVGNGASFQSVIFEGVDASTDLMGLYGSETDVRRVSFFWCGIHGFEQAIWSSGYARILWVEGCCLSRNVNAIKDTVDSRYLNNFINANSGNAVSLNSGANDNSFVSNKIEFNGGHGVRLDTCYNNNFVGGIIDASTDSNFTVVNAECTLTGAILRRGGRNETGYNLYLYGAYRFVGSSLILRHGTGDGAVPPDTPTIGIRIEQASNRITLHGVDAQHCTTPLSESSAGYDWLDIRGCDGIDDRRVDTLAGSFQFTPTNNWHYRRTDSNSNTITAGGSRELLWSLPVSGFGTRRPIQFRFTVIKNSTGAMDMVTYTGFIARTNPSAAIASSTTFTGARYGTGTAFQLTLGTASGLLQPSISSLATDGSTIGITIANTDSADWVIVEATCRPF